MAEAEVKTFWQRQRLAEAEVENPHILLKVVYRCSLSYFAKVKIETTPLRQFHELAAFGDGDWGGK